MKCFIKARSISNTVSNQARPEPVTGTVMRGAGYQSVFLAFRLSRMDPDCSGEGDPWSSAYV